MSLLSRLACEQLHEKLIRKCRVPYREIKIKKPVPVANKECEKCKQTINKKGFACIEGINIKTLTALFQSEEWSISRQRIIFRSKHCIVLKV